MRIHRSVAGGALLQPITSGSTQFISNVYLRSFVSGSADGIAVPVDTRAVPHLFPVNHVKHGLVDITRGFIEFDRKSGVLVEEPVKEPSYEVLVTCLSVTVPMRLVVQAFQIGGEFLRRLTFVRVGLAGQHTIGLFRSF